MCEDNKLEKKMKKGIRKIINTMPFPANMDAVHTFLSGYSDRVAGIDSYTKITPDGEEREVNVNLPNGDLFTVVADKKIGCIEKYLINLDSLENKGFYYTKEGSQPWIG